MSAMARSIKIRYWQSDLLANAAPQLRPVVGLSTFDLDKFRDLLAVAAHEIAPHGLADAYVSTLLGSGPHTS
jgi:hypothetical protein